MTEPQMRSNGRHMRNRVLKSARNKWIAMCMALTMVLSLGVVGAIAFRWQTNLHTGTLNSSDYNGIESGALDILIIGSDTRQGANGNYGDENDRASAARSDVMMLLQISKDKKNVNVLSIPRDLIVTIPKCHGDDGVDYPEEENMINESLSHGGPGCTVATVSKLTGVQIDHFMLVDFNAVKVLSNVVGGVEVCVDEAIDDPSSGLDIPAGTSSVQGEQALAFLRSRHGFGDGSDIGRIQAQQSFLASLLRKVKSEGTLSNPGKLVEIANAVTENTTVDKDLANVSTLVSVGSTMAGVDLKNVVFATVPTEPWVKDNNRLQVTKDADAVFKRLQEDKSLKVDASEQPPAPVVNLDKSVAVTVTNGSGVTGRAQTIASVVSNGGYENVTPMNGVELIAKSTVFYADGYEAEARDIAAKMNITNILPLQGIAGIAVTVGTDFTEGDALPKQETEIAGSASGQTADQVKCQHASIFG